MGGRAEALLVETAVWPVARDRDCDHDCDLCSPSAALGLAPYSFQPAASPQSIPKHHCPCHVKRSMLLSSVAVQPYMSLSFSSAGTKLVLGGGLVFDPRPHPAIAPIAPSRPWREPAHSRVGITLNALPSPAYD